MTEINGESTSMVWPTLELRMAREENGTGCCISIIYYTTCDLQGYANKANDIKNIFKKTYHKPAPAGFSAVCGNFDALSAFDEISFSLLLRMLRPNTRKRGQDSPYSYSSAETLQICSTWHKPAIYKKSQKDSQPYSYSITSWI